MKLRRTALFAALATTGLVALSACSNGQGGSGDANALSIAATTTSKPAMEQIVADFEEANPEVTVNVTYADTDALVTTLRTQLSSGTAPDVFSVWPGYGNSAGMNILQEAGYLADLSDQPWVAEIPEGLKDLTQVDGQTYILPTAVVGIGAIYNETAVNEIGATVPTTWSELLDFCADANSADKVAFALGAQTSWVTQLVNYALVPTLVFEPDATFDEQMAAGDATFVGSGWEDAFAKYVEMNDAGCFNAAPLGTAFETTVTDVASGNALAVVQVTSTLAQIRDAAAEETEFGMFALPATDDAEQTWMPAAMGDTYGLNAAAKNPELGQKFLDFLASSDEMAAYSTLAGTLPALPSDSFQPDQALQILVDFQAEGRTYPFMDQFWPNTKVQPVHLDGVQKVLGGTASIDDVLAEMDAAYQEGSAK